MAEVAVQGEAGVGLDEGVEAQQQRQPLLLQTA